MDVLRDARDVVIAGFGANQNDRGGQVSITELIRSESCRWSVGSVASLSGLREWKRAPTRVS